MRIADVERSARASAPREWSSPGASTAALVLAARAGEHEAWDVLVERFAPLVIAVAARCGVRGADAADVSQVVWLQLVQRLDALREPAALPGWLAVTARRECLRHLAAGQRTRPVDPADDLVLGDAVCADGLDEVVARHETHREVRAAYARLDRRDQQLLALVTADPRLPYDEIGRRLGMPVGSIGPTRARALGRLARALDEVRTRRPPQRASRAAPPSAAGGRPAVCRLTLSD